MRTAAKSVKTNVFESVGNDPPPPLLCVGDINAQVKCWLYISAKEIALPLIGDRDQEAITPNYHYQFIS